MHPDVFFSRTEHFRLKLKGSKIFVSFYLGKIISGIMSSAAPLATGLTSTVTLNDGVVMPLFGLGTYMLSTGSGGGAESITTFALQNGYRLLDTATFYG